MVNDVLGYLPDSVGSADDGLQLRPLGLEPLLALDFLSLGGFLEIRVNCWPLGVIKFQPGQAAFVVDGHGGPVLHGTPDVVDADVIPENGPGVGVLQFNGRAGKPNEGSVGQGVPHVPGEAVDKVVLAAVGLVGNDHNVAPFR